MTSPLILFGMFRLCTTHTDLLYPSPFRSGTLQLRRPCSCCWRSDLLLFRMSLLHRECMRRTTAVLGLFGRSPICTGCIGHSIQLHCRSGTYQQDIARKNSDLCQLDTSQFHKAYRRSVLCRFDTSLIHTRCSQLEQIVQILSGMFQSRTFGSCSCQTRFDTFLVHTIRRPTGPYLMNRIQDYKESRNSVLYTKKHRIKR